MSKERRLPASRLGRLAQMGRLAGGLAGGMASEGVRRLARGDRPSMRDMLLTAGNMNKLGTRLSEMRGAAMKIGQLLSMDSGEVLPAELSELLARLREDAHPMPLGQVADCLEARWGNGWDRRFKRFNFSPVAAASIGQVHQAELHDGLKVAVKLQYPGVRKSIDSDVDNVAGLLRTFRLLPEGMDVGPLLDEARQQLHAEADYRLEAAALTRFAQNLADDPRFQLPGVVGDFSGRDVLTMTYLDGGPLEALSDATAATRNAVGAQLIELALREVFEWGYVQTDPNFANYLYDAAGKRIQLLDFGAVRSYDPARRENLATLLAAALDGADDDLAAAATATGYLGDGDPAAYRQTVVDLLRTATEPARQRSDYNFGQANLAQRMSDRVIEMRLRHRFTRLPPTDILFLHRRLGGLYLLLTKLRARIPVHQLIQPLRGSAAPAGAHPDARIATA